MAVSIEQDFQGRVQLWSSLGGTLLISLVISKSTLGRSLTLLIQEHSRKKSKTATVNNVCSSAATWSDLCDDTDTNLLYILLVPKLYCKCIANNMNFNSARYGCWHLVNELGVTWLKLLGSNYFLIPNNESTLAGTDRLVTDRSQKSGSIPEC